jgi:hypothetical protein
VTDDHLTIRTILTHIVDNVYIGAPALRDEILELLELGRVDVNAFLAVLFLIRVEILPVSVRLQ